MSIATRVLPLDAFVALYGQVCLFNFFLLTVLKENFVNIFLSLVDTRRTYCGTALCIACLSSAGETENSTL
jgi:hypothetical protein